MLRESGKEGRHLCKYILHKMSKFAILCKGTADTIELVQWYTFQVQVWHRQHSQKIQATLFDFRKQGLCGPALKVSLFNCFCMF